VHQQIKSDIWLNLTLLFLGLLFIYHLPNRTAVMFIICGTLVALVALIRQPILTAMDPKLSNAIDSPESPHFAAAVAQCKTPAEVEMLHAGWNMGFEVGKRRAKEGAVKKVHHGEPPICGPVDRPLRRKRRLDRPSLSQIDRWLTKDEATIAAAGDHTEQYKDETALQVSVGSGGQGLVTDGWSWGLDSTIAPVESIVLC
jgi:hypothetical protein